MNDLIRKTTLALILLGCVGVAAIAQPADVIGGLHWGSDSDEAVQAYGEPAYTGGAATTYLQYDREAVAGHLATLLLLFDGSGGLFGAMFDLGGYRESTEIFESIDAELTRLHGEPTLAEVRRPPSLSEDGFSWTDIAAGDVTLFSGWDNGDMTILHAAFRHDGRPGNITHQVFYADPEVLSVRQAHQNLF